MISLEQVQLLETKVAGAIDYVQRVTAENATLILEREGLQAKLSANKKRIDELEVLIMRFKEDQGRIEDGIIAALDRLSQFEEAFENSLKDKVTAKKPVVKEREKQSEQVQDSSSNSQVFFEIPEPPDDSTEQSGLMQTASRNSRPVMETGRDIQLNSQPAHGKVSSEPPEGGQHSVDGELDIF
ncbi:MAG: cell division protein ZapB [Treponema sp.]|nr:cell division protein ZapB [Treponema sp.]